MGDNVFRKSLRILLVERGVHDSRGDRVDADAVLRVFHRQAPGHGVQAALGDHGDRGVIPAIGLSTSEAVIVTMLPPDFCDSIRLIASCVM